MSTDSTTQLIHARGLTKRFGSFTAVDAVDFDVQPGEAFGFVALAEEDVASFDSAVLGQSRQLFDAGGR